MILVSPNKEAQVTMTNPNLTYLRVIVDRSGSMAPIRTDTEKGLNTFIEEQRKGEGDVIVSLTEFNTYSTETYFARPINEVPAYFMSAGGGTALLDAVGDAIVRDGNHFRSLPEELRPGNIVVVILTDGEENSSRRYSRARIKDMISEQTGTYSWNFIFMGANVDAFHEASLLGISTGSTLQYAHTSGGTLGSFAGASSSVLRGRAMSASGAESAAVMDSYNFTPEERTAAADDETDNT